jgi:heavy metal translocating P-type ATPase
LTALNNALDTREPLLIELTPDRQAPMDLAVTFPAQGVIRLQSHALFHDPGSTVCRRFLERVFQADEISNVVLKGGPAPEAELRFCPRTFSLREVVKRIAAFLRLGVADEPAATSGAGHGHIDALARGNGNGNGNGHASAHAHVDGQGHGHDHRAAVAVAEPPGDGSRNGVSRPHNRLPRPVLKERTVAQAVTARDRHGVVRYYRHDTVVTGWQVKHESPGRLKLKNPVLYRKSDLCQAIERELMSVLGVDKYKTSSLFSTVTVDYDPAQLTRGQVLEILDSALAAAEHPTKLDRLDLHLPICTAALPLTATAQFVVPGLLPAAAVLFAYTSIPTFKAARDVLFEEKRLGVDVLDAIVVLGCLGTMAIFPGAVLCWCLSFGRVLVKKTQDDSKKLLLNAFGKQPRYVWLYQDDGTEVQVSLDKLHGGDTIVVHTGEVVPVDGVVVDGMAVIDQHALTGESTPAEKGVGDKVFASTVMVAGKMLVSVERSGSETASSQIAQILNDTAGYKMASQHKGEVLADKAVIPTLAIGALGLATMGPAGAVAVLNSDFGTGIRMAAPLAMLSSLSLCASKGVLVKDGRALELINEVDTVLFDKTGTLTRERPEVGRVIAAAGFSDRQILQYAAAAEHKFHHPIALAILHRAEELAIPLPPTDETQYKVGYGIIVGVDGHTVRVGSKRFMEMEGIALTDEVQEALDEAHLEGYTMVMVAVDERLGGAVELRASVRPEVRAIVAGLRKRGIKHIAIISGDHEAPTRKLAHELGMDRYFAQVLPADKAEYVAKLQQEGRKVCFVGDGINDSIALKKANVSISLRGASSIATDTAHIVFLEEGLAKLCELKDIARELDHNVKRSWSLILAPNIACIIGVFTMGFGIMASVVTNNVAALAALGNGILPLRKVAQIEAERRHKLEMSRAYALERNAV